MQKGISRDKRQMSPFKAISCSRFHCHFSQVFAIKAKQKPVKQINKSCSYATSLNPISIQEEVGNFPVKELNGKEI